MQVNVVDYETARTLGTIEIADSLWRLYADCRHPGYQWPQGIARAVSVLTPSQIAEMGISNDTTVYLEE